MFNNLFAKKLFSKCIKLKLFVLLISFISIPLSNLAFAKEEQLSQKLPVEEVQRFTTVIEHVKNYYVNSIEDQKLFENAIRGMLAGLDPHSTYLNKEEFEDLKLSTTGKFGGLGIEVTLRDGFINVISPIDGTPAEKAGIKAGDIIVRLDDTPVKGLTLREAVDKMRGERGEPITLTIIRESEAKPLVIEVVRDIINVKSVRSEILEEEFGYIRISNFQNDTGTEVINILNKLKRDTNNKLKGVILDLRNNPGGVLEASVQVADAVLDRKKLKHDGIIVYTKGRIATSQINETANPNDLLNGAPIVVLVNRGSASASEIVAGALQDHKRAIIMGTKTFGKGSVQTILPLRDNRGLKLTTALYYTPSGVSIQAEGITPDVILQEVKVPEPKEEKPNFFVSERDLERHLETSKEKKSNSKNTSKKESYNEKKEKPLVYRDFQLHEALNMLKGMSLING